MIKSFASKETMKIWEGNWSAKFLTEIQQVGRRKLRMLNNSISIFDLRLPPSKRMEKMGGDLKDYHSIRINDQWRIIFKWRDDHSYEVKIVDYHK